MIVVQSLNYCIDREFELQNSRYVYMIVTKLYPIRDSFSNIPLYEKADCAFLANGGFIGRRICDVSSLSAKD